MRITGGRLGRRPIQGPPPKSTGTRPTTDRVREALFSALAARMDLHGARVLDLFAGTGALGLEALSRGAAHAAFVERHGPALALARRNAASLDLQSQTAFVRADALAHADRQPDAAFDLVLADPPYAHDALPELPGRVLRLVAPGGLLVLEHGDRHEYHEDPAVVFSRDYGATRLTFFSPD